MAQSDALDHEFRHNLFAHAIDNLNRLEQFQPQAMLDQIIQQLNQSVDWKRDVDWRSDPLVAALPAEIQRLPLLESLDDSKLNAFDANHLHEAVTLRDVALAAAGDANDDVTRAQRLFDWTVRNIEFPRDGELGADDQGRPIEAHHVPYETLFFGRGGPIDRAWTFMLLARQLDIDTVLLYVSRGPDSQPQPWCVGALVGDDIYLFDPSLGLPVPGPNGQGVATLKQALEDDAVLRQLDLSPDRPYPLKSSELQGVIAMIEASPGYLSRRMKVLEAGLTGERKLVLTAEPSRVAERLKDSPGVSKSQLWMLPLERRANQASPANVAAMQREVAPYLIGVLPEDFRPVAAALQRGRILHLKGILAAGEGEPSANRYYQAARMADSDIAKAPLNPAQRLVLERAKDDASYWLGLVAYDRGRYDAAADHFQKRTIDAEGDAKRWEAGAYYNLGRAREAQGELEEAAKAYEASPDPRQHYGNQLRAKLAREREKLTAAEPATAE